MKAHWALDMLLLVSVLFVLAVDRVLAFRRRRQWDGTDLFGLLLLLAALLLCWKDRP